MEISRQEHWSRLLFPFPGDYPTHVRNLGLLHWRQTFAIGTLCDSMDYSPPGSSPWDSPGKNTGGSCQVLPQGIFLTSGRFFTTEPPGKPICAVAEEGYLVGKVDTRGKKWWFSADVVVCRECRGMCLCCSLVEWLTCKWL